MAKGKRRRIEPTAAGDTHNIYGATGLGASNDSDAEGVIVISDRLTFGSAILNNHGSGAGQSAGWVSCADCSILRVKVDYYANSGEREFLVLFRDTADVPTPGAKWFSVENTGLETAASSGKYHGATYFVFDCRGMKDFAIAVKAGSPNVDVYAAAA